MPTDFLITALIVVLIPGTGVIYTVSTGLLQGRRASIAAAVGCTLGIVPHLMAGALGLSALLHVSALAFSVLKWVGVTYLLFIAWSMWRESGAIRFEQTSAPASIARIIVRGILLNILNPKLTLFFFAFLPQFIHPQAGSAPGQLLGLSLVFMGMTLAVFLLYGLGADVSRSLLTRSARTVRGLQKGFAVLFAGLGLRLAASEL